MDTSGITTFEQSYEAQCDNYKKQIYLLQDKIAYYERDYHQNNLKLKVRLKEIEERDYYFQKEITFRENQLEKMSELLQEKASTVAELQSTIDRLSSHNLQENNKIYSTIVTERDQISSVNDNLKEEKESLQQTVAELTEDNKAKEKEITELKEENHLFNNDNSVLLKKIQEYEENYSIMQRDKSIIESKLNSKIEQCGNYEKRLLNFERELEDHNNNLSNEIKTMTQWVETYFEFLYPSNYDIPSLINKNNNSTASTNGNSNSNCNTDNKHNTHFYYNIDVLKKALETSRIKINKEQNTLEAYMQKQKSEISDLISIRDKKQNEINWLRDMIQELKEHNNLLQVDNDNFLNELTESKQILNKFHQSIESIANDNDNYLFQMYSNIKNELDAMMKDDTFVHYNQIILKNNCLNKIGAKDCNSRQYLFEDVLDRLLHFVSLLTDDYKDLKKENFVLSNESMTKKGVCYKEVNDLNAQISLLKSELSNMEISKSKNNDENMLLMNQINMLEHSLHGKEEIIAQLKKDIQYEKNIN